MRLDSWLLCITPVSGSIGFNSSNSMLYWRKAWILSRNGSCMTPKSSHTQCQLMPWTLSDDQTMLSSVDDLAQVSLIRGGIDPVVYHSPLGDVGVSRALRLSIFLVYIQHGMFRAWTDGILKGDALFVHGLARALTSGLICWVNGVSTLSAMSFQTTDELG